jgi:hypothetical protein
MEGEAMVLTAGEGVTRNRMTYTRQAQGAVRQLVERSTDGGASGRRNMTSPTGRRPANRP